MLPNRVRCSTSSYDAVVNANNDTLYSTTFADLRTEPLVISVPATGDRYFVIQLVDMSTDNVAYTGTRATGRDGGDFLLVRTQHRSPLPEGFTRVLAPPSEFVALATRTAIDGPDDLPAVVAIQEQLRLRPLSEVRGTEPPPTPPQLSLPPYTPDLYGSPALLGLLNALLPFHTLRPYEHALTPTASRCPVRTLTCSRSRSADCHRWRHSGRSRSTTPTPG